MKVLYFHQHFSTPKGSTGIRSYEAAVRLVSKGHQVTMVCGKYGIGNTGLTSDFINGVRRGKVDGIDIIEYDLPYSNSTGFLKRTMIFLQFIIKTIKLVFTEKYDVLFSTTTPLTVGIPGIFARWFRRKPFVFEVRDLWPELPRAMGVIKSPVILWAMGVLEFASYRSADLLIGLSPGIVDGIAKRGVPRDKITFVPNGCDIKLLNAPHDKWTHSSINDDDTVAIFCGTHGIANGLDAVLDAAAELIKMQKFNIKFLLVGDGKLKSGLIKRAESENLSNVIFCDPVNKYVLSGMLSRADIGMQILANVPAFYYGTSPNKFFDYIASGTPVLCNYPGWVADIIKENNCGYSVSPERPDLFANALIHASEHKKELEEAGKRAGLLALEKFNRDNLTDDMIAVIEKAYSLKHKES